MVYMHNSISVIDKQQQSSLTMNNYVNSRHNNKKGPTSSSSSSPNGHKIPPFYCCDHRSRWAAVDLVILIAVLVACGFLLFPYIKIVSFKSIEASAVVFRLVKLEVVRNPVVYGTTAVTVCCAAVAAWVVVLCATTRRCGNPGCKGLRKAAEFDIQLETEDCVKHNSNNSSSVDGSGGGGAGGGGGGGVKKGLFELPRDHHRELEAELRKMAPPNGRAVLIFRARCGCSVGKLEVPGPKKQRKFKK